MGNELVSPSSATSAGPEASAVDHGNMWSPVPIDPHAEISNGSQPSNTTILDPWDYVTRNLEAIGVDLAPPPPRREADLPTLDSLPGASLSDTVIDLRSRPGD